MEVIPNVSPLTDERGNILMREGCLCMDSSVISVCVNKIIARKKLVTSSLTDKILFLFFYFELTRTNPQVHHAKFHGKVAA